MNKDSRKIRTYLKIIDFLRESNKREFYPKVTDIVEQLAKSDIEVSARTVQRYLYDLNNEFAVYIDKRGKLEGYEICMEEIRDFKEIYETFRLLEKAGYFKEVDQKSKNSLQYIAFDGKQFTGYDHIASILDAITRSRVIIITHKKFEEEENERKVKPYLLKEYNNRWYLTGYDFNAKEVRHFGLDRVTRIRITNEKFDTAEAAGVKDRFKNVIGIVGDRPPEEVLLKVKDSQIGYFRTYPWHESTTITRDENGQWIVKMFVSVNYELEQLILMNHRFVQVIKPKHLAKDIKGLLAKALRQYS